MNKKIPYRCDLCDYEYYLDDESKAAEIWEKHIKTDIHASNVINNLIDETGAEDFEDLKENINFYIDRLLTERGNGYE